MLEKDSVKGVIGNSLIYAWLMMEIWSPDKTRMKSRKLFTKQKVSHFTIKC